MLQRDAMVQRRKIPQVNDIRKAKLKIIADKIKDAYKGLGVPKLTSTDFEEAFRIMVEAERDVWEMRTGLYSTNEEPEIDYRLRALLSNSRNFPSILSSLLKSDR